MDRHKTKEAQQLGPPRPFKVTQICFLLLSFQFLDISYWCFQLVLNFANWTFFLENLKIWIEVNFCLNFEIWSYLFHWIWHIEYSKLIWHILYLVPFVRLTNFIALLNPWSSYFLLNMQKYKISRIFLPQHLSKFALILEIFWAIRNFKFLNLMYVCEYVWAFMLRWTYIIYHLPYWVHNSWQASG